MAKDTTEETVTTTVVPEVAEVAAEEIPTVETTEAPAEVEVTEAPVEAVESTEASPVLGETTQTIEELQESARQEALTNHRNDGHEV